MGSRIVRADLLAGAERAVNGDRDADYGDPVRDFERQAAMIQAYLEGVVEHRGELRIDPVDVAAIMVIVKTSRLVTNPAKKDSWLDIAGYAACGWDCAVDAQETQ
jgi:hypothetical protein